MKKKILAIFMTALMVVSLIPMFAFTALANDQHNLKVTKIVSGEEISATLDEDYEWQDNTLTIKKDDLIVSGTTATESIVVDLEVSTITLREVKLVPTESGKIATGISSSDHSNNLTITLVGENQIGNTVIDGTNAEAYFVECGISYGYNITFTGEGNLKIYDQLQGIQANGNVIFDNNFSGKLTIDDFGAAPVCAIRTTGKLELLGGTFDIKSHYSNGIYAEGDVTIKDAKVTIDAKEIGIHAVDADVTIDENAIVTITAGQTGIEAEEDEVDGIGNISIKNAKVEIEISNDSGGNLYGINANVTITIDNSIVTATITQMLQGDNGAYGISCEEGTIRILGNNTCVEVTAIGGDIAAGIIGTDIIVDDGTVKAKAMEGSEGYLSCAIGAMNRLEINTDKLKILNAEYTEVGGMKTLNSKSSDVEDGYVVIKPKLEPHDVTVEVQGSHGTASLKIGDEKATTASQAFKDTSIVFTATANSGYEFDYWEVVKGGIKLKDKTKATLNVVMPDEDLTLKAHFKASVPEVIKGNDQKVKAGSKEEVTFTSNAPFDTFERVLVDGKEITKDKDYTVTKGSTIVTLKAEYVATLKAGEHKVEIVSKGGTATAKLTITDTPETGDANNMLLWSLLLALSIIGIAVGTFYKRLQRKK